MPRYYVRVTVKPDPSPQDSLHAARIAMKEFNTEREAPTVTAAVSDTEREAVAEGYIVTGIHCWTPDRS